MKTSKIIILSISMLLIGCDEIKSDFNQVKIEYNNFVNDSKSNNEKSPNKTLIVENNENSRKPLFFDKTFSKYMKQVNEEESKKEQNINKTREIPEEELIIEKAKTFDAYLSYDACLKDWKIPDICNGEKRKIEKIITDNYTKPLKTNSQDYLMPNKDDDKDEYEYVESNTKVDCRYSIDNKLNIITTPPYTYGDRKIVVNGEKIEPIGNNSFFIFVIINDTNYYPIVIPT